jgi:hypothetical protein
VKIVKDIKVNLGADLKSAIAAARKMFDPDYAQREAWDISSAANILQQLAQLAGGEAAENESDDVQELANIMRALMAFIGGEIDEMLGGGNNGTMQAAYAKAIAAREDVTPADKKRAKQEYGDVTFADEKNKKYPLDTEEHIRTGWNYIHQDKNREPYSAAEVADIEKRMIAAWKDKIDKAGPPSVAKDKGATKSGARNSTTDLQRLQQIHDLAVANGAMCGMEPDDDEPRPTIEVVDNNAAMKIAALPDQKVLTLDHKLGGAVKSLDGDRLTGPAVLFGDPDHTDLTEYRDFFAPDTDFWLDLFKGMPMIFDHGVIDHDMVDAFAKAAKSSEEIDAVKEFRAAMKDLDRDPRVGEWTKAMIDPLALWVEGETNKARKYAAYVKQMVDRGIIRISSDTNPVYMRRERQANGANKIVRWPLVAASITSHAAEPRLAPVAALKSFFDSIGVTPTVAFVEAATEGAMTARSVAAVQIARARLNIQRMKLELGE